MNAILRTVLSLFGWAFSLSYPEVRWGYPISTGISGGVLSFALLYSCSIKHCVSRPKHFSPSPLVPTKCMFNVPPSWVIWDQHHWSNYESSQDHFHFHIKKLEWSCYWVKGVVFCCPPSPPPQCWTPICFLDPVGCCVKAVWSTL